MFEATINGIEITISEKGMSDNAIAFAEKVLNEYPGKVTAISEYLSQDEGIMTCYDNITKEEIAEKLHEPKIRIMRGGGMLSYCNHELDAGHIIDLEFDGVLETFGEVDIDG